MRASLTIRSSLATLAVLAFIFASVTPTQASPSVLEQVLVPFRMVRGVEARFVETKTIALLRNPVTSEGVVYFQPPSRLARHTLRPVPSSVVLDGGELRFGDARGEQSIDLRRNVVARVFVDAFRSVLAGDSATLARGFETHAELDQTGAFTLTLSPRDAALRRVLARVRAFGRGASLTSFEVVEVNGDVTITTFSRIRTDRAFSRDEIRRLFRVGGR